MKINRLAGLLTESAALTLIVAIIALVVIAIQRPPGPAGGEYSPCTAGGGGYLVGELHGALELDIDWRGAAFSCSGAPRPDNAGLRLVFRSSPEHEPPLVFVLGIDGQLDQLVDGEHVVNVTVIDESSGNFFSSQRQPRCWTRIERTIPLGGPVWRIDGDLWCLGSLPALDGAGHITPGEFAYSGRFQ